MCQHVVLVYCQKTIDLKGYKKLVAAKHKKIHAFGSFSVACVGYSGYEQSMNSLLERAER